MVVAGQVAGRWTAARGPRWPMAIGCLLSGGGMFAVDALLDAERRRSALAAALALVGFGLGLALVAVTSAVLTIVPAGAVGHGGLDREHEPRSSAACSPSRSSAR